MKTKSKSSKSEQGITLVALIITIIVLVILAAVSIAAVYNSKIVEYALNGSQNYTQEALRENAIMKGTESVLESGLSRIQDIVGGNAETSTPEQPKVPLTIDEIEIGSYVDYSPAGNSAYTVDDYYTGVAEAEGTSSQTFSATDGMKWRVLSKEGNTLKLISATGGNTITLQGANGYNNAVKILNDACSTAYSNTTLGLTARSINQEDIDAITNMTTDAQRKAAYSYYAPTTAVTPSSNNCPSIYPTEIGYEGGTSGTGRSVQTGWVTGTTTFTSGAYTYYTYAISTYAADAKYYAMLTCQTGDIGSTSHTSYWIASRCTNIDSTVAYFYMFRVKSGEVHALNMYVSNGDIHTPSYAVRPVVEVNLNSYNIGTTGSGTSTSPYSIAKK